MASATGRPMVLHVADRAKAARHVDRVIITAPDPEIVDAARAAGVEAIPTSFDHPNGTSRLAEVADRLADELSPDAVLVNVQGDEPEIEPEAIDAVVAALRDDPAAEMATIATPFEPGEDPNNPNIVKVVTDSLRGR